MWFSVIKFSVLIIIQTELLKGLALSDTLELFPLHLNREQSAGCVSILPHPTPFRSRYQRMNLKLGIWSWDSDISEKKGEFLIPFKKSQSKLVLILIQFLILRENEKARESERAGWRDKAHIHVPLGEVLFLGWVLALLFAGPQNDVLSWVFQNVSWTFLSSERKFSLSTCLKERKRFGGEN